MTDQKKGLIEKRDFRKSSDYHYSDDSTFQPEQKASLPHFFSNRESDEDAEGSVQQAWCEQRARLPHFFANRENAKVAEGSVELA